MDENAKTQVQKIIDGMGTIVELWLITYTHFAQKGMPEDAAIKHTQALIASMIGQVMG